MCEAKGLPLFQILNISAPCNVFILLCQAGRYDLTPRDPGMQVYPFTEFAAQCKASFTARRKAIAAGDSPLRFDIFSRQCYACALTEHIWLEQEE